MTAASAREVVQAALARAHAGDIAGALVLLDATTRAHPGHLPAWLVLAGLQSQQNDNAAPFATLDAAVRACGASSAIEGMRASLLLRWGRNAEAADAARAALSLEPDAPGMQRTLGFALAAQQLWRDAMPALETALAINAADLPARLALVRCALHAGQADRALAVALVDAVIDAQAARSQVLADFGAAGAWPLQFEVLRQWQARAPRDADAAIAVATTAHRLGHLGEALAACEHALALLPDARRPREIRATSLVDRGDVEAGLAEYRPLLDGDAEASARHLVLMHYDPAQDDARLFAAITTHVARHVPRIGAPFAARGRRDPERPLRIGWISPRFAAGPVASFLPPLLRAFDRTDFQHVLVALEPVSDTTSWQALGDDWIALPGLDDATLLQRLRALELDVIVDLAGHATGNRSTVLAQRVAPVQLAWLDWFDTTGLPAMDAFVSDPWLTPPDSPQRYTERVLHLPSGRFCYAPPADAPPPMHAGDGDVVFASFNRLAKLNDRVLAAWSAILRAVPGARLALGARFLDDADTRAHVAARFARHGIARERLDLHGHRPYAALLEAYRGVDIALDPFPFSGCTTTCDALYMGCAVVTLAGSTFVSRQGASLLWRLRRDAWVARDMDEYLALAVALARDATTLRAGRSTLRANVERTLCDGPSQAREFAALVRQLWRDYCAR
jgi:predicted O-linked N-acetylglucosamine transferase (SPINDLY family)